MSKTTTSKPAPEAGAQASSGWTPALVADQFDVSRETMDRLERYVDVLTNWQRRINLIGRSTLDDIWGRHIADSLQLARLAPEEALIWLDLGSGAGLPGLVLAIVLGSRSGFHMHLVDSNGRKCAFLQAAAAATSAPVSVHHASIERLGAASEPIRADVITARALAPLVRLIPLARPFMWKKTVLLLPKGQDVETELTAAAISSTLRVERRPSVVNPAATILRIEEAQQ